MAQHEPIMKPFLGERCHGSEKSWTHLSWSGLNSEALTGTEARSTIPAVSVCSVGGFDHHRNEIHYGATHLGSYFRYFLRVHLSPLGRLGNCAQPHCDADS
jgi:hypothetical protein